MYLASTSNSAISVQTLSSAAKPSPPLNRMLRVGVCQPGVQEGQKHLTFWPPRTKWGALILSAPWTASKMQQKSSGLWTTQDKCHHKNFPMHLTPQLERCTLVCYDLYSNVHFPYDSMTFSNSQQTTKMAKVT